MRSVFITGAFGGLGRELVKAFSSFDKVFAHGRAFDPDFSNSFFTEVTRVYGSLSDISAMRVMNSRFFEDEEGLDVLINNAAVYENKPFDKITTFDIQHILNVNLCAPIFLSRMLWDKLKKRRGIIININSLAGKQGGQGESLYSATKHGLSGWSKSVQFDATTDGIRILNVYCGAMKTKMSAGRKDWDKFISPEEVAREIFQLCERRETLRVTEIEFMRSQY